MIGTKGGSFRGQAAGAFPSAVRLPAASRWAQVVRRQRSPFRVARLPASVAVQHLKSSQPSFFAPTISSPILLPLLYSSLLHRVIAVFLTRGKKWRRRKNRYRENIKGEGGAFTDLALFAGDGSVPGLGFAHLTLQSRVFRLLVFLYDMLHRSVLGQIMGSAFVEVNGLLTNRTGEAQSAARRWKASVSGCADIASRSRAGGGAAADHAGICLGKNGEFVGFLVGARRVRGIGRGLRRRVRRCL